MRGYLLADKPGELRAPEDGWYDTGDIVEIDEAGYVFIKGRAKRFAKVGGEMISLAAVEAMVSRLWPEHGHVVVNLPDERKGEQLILLTEKQDASRDELAAFAKTEGLSSLGVPRTLIPVDRIPLLGTGKTDFVTASKMAQEQVG
jgi:acyl-[acyl-carrier-protein]-phospholipid O-acyltransferase/long-chain-fatty-acid--[acyl-carrier-protein] ligase